MNDALFDEFFDLLMDLEGGYSNRKEDNGGKTNFGITQYLFDSINKMNKKESKDVKYLTKEEAKEIYFNEFYSKVQKVANTEVFYNLFDMCVNSGYGNYKIMLRYLKDKNLITYPNAVYTYRENYYKSLNQTANINGWMNRLNKIKNHFKHEAIAA